MKIIIITILYKDAINDLYRNNKSLSFSSYKKQKIIVDSEISIWASGWEDVLTKIGHNVMTIPINVSALQKKWAEENDIHLKNLHDIAYEQVKLFEPDIIWYDYFDITLLKKIKSNINSIKLILGWTGSVIVNLNILKETDLVLSCSPETVQKLNNIGATAEHLDHAFNNSLLNNSIKFNRNNDFIFIGQIIKGSGLHNQREKLLKKLVNKFDIKIYSSSYNYGFKKIFAASVKKFSNLLFTPFMHSKYFRNILNDNLYLTEILNAKNIPLIPYDNQLKKRLYPPVYGKKMYKTIAESLLVLNIHADSSPNFASNMRLFETTGIGTTLLTDWKKNINNLFKIDKEILTYKTPEECFEKASWLLNNPNKCIEIGKEGQKRTLLNYTYAQRVQDLLKIIEKYI